MILIPGASWDPSQGGSFFSSLGEGRSSILGGCEAKRVSRLTWGVVGAQLRSGKEQGVANFCALFLC